ncbi:MAG: hypothetical protein H6696_04330 [Deferribacteres bacterium]|nr:hypothetical protein [candidate division KSB1 bacterium]MCB9501142.1 hypothetical protein [Deferribacteres bacterium]
MRTTNSILLLLLMCAWTLAAQTEKIGDKADGNRSLPVHRIKLFDENGDVVKPYHERSMPFSLRETCGRECHSYDTISQGWHFESGFGSNDSGRAGAPWIFSDQFSATQIPLSWRAWPGTVHPQEIGMTPFQFVKDFGGFYPGGALGEADSVHSLDNYFRWNVAGKQEINCLACHETNPAYNPAEYVTQMKKQNYRWAATAASGIGQMEGSAAKMPDNYDLYGTFDAPSPNDPVPMVFYEETPFNRRGEVLFQVKRKVPNEKCYACHSTAVVGENAERWHGDDDVHIAAGMSCVDCHRNGLNHKITRGYEGEKNGIVSLTCAGCHLGDDAESVAGRMGAPKPQHAGLPPVHFEKLSCTACHSGPVLGNESADIKTSISHKLGTVGVNKSATAMPHVQAPIFLPGHDGKIAPHKIMWPSYWVDVRDDSIHILPVENIRTIVLQKSTYRDTLHSGDWPQLSDSLLATILDSLAQQDTTLQQVGYISGGLLFTAKNDSEVVAQPHSAGKPYTWALAHDVRPARQSLGIAGCNDCHAYNSPFAFASVSPPTPVLSAQGRVESMTVFRGASHWQTKLFALAFYFRPVLKLILAIVALLLVAVLALYAFKGLATLTQNLASKQSLDKG